MLSSRSAAVLLTMMVGGTAYFTETGRDGVEIYFDSDIDTSAGKSRVASFNQTEIIIDKAIEFDGAAEFDAAVTFDSTADFNGVVDASAGIVARLTPARFCGQGADASGGGPVSVFISPDTHDGNGSLLASTHCDAEDSATEATADEVLYNWAVKPVAMTCMITDGGTDDVVTFQLRDDTADVTGMTCNVTLTGSGTKSCTVTDATPVTVAAGSAIAVEVTVATNDNCAACDVLCEVYLDQ